MTTSGKKTQAHALPDSMVALLSDADKRNGLPPGTMFSVMQQEVGANSDKYLQDPAAYHYGLNAEGKRIAGHTGKVSTAFGPFGILESTAADPGYGVQPLQNKSIEEQIRFASDYLGGRVKQAGSLQAGLAGYGEGPKYADQVMARAGGAPAPVAPVVTAPVVAQAPVPVAPQVPVEQVAVAAPAQAAPDPGAPATVGPDPWTTFNQALVGRPPEQAAAPQGNPPLFAQAKMPDFSGFLGGYGQSLKPNMQAFSRMKSWG